MAVSIGIASLTLLVGMLSGLQEKSRRMVEELGVNVLAILQQGGDDDSPARDKPRLREKHLGYLRANLPDCRVAGMRRYKTPSEGVDAELTVLATDDSFLSVRQWRMRNGRYFDRNDVTGGERYAVISRRLSEAQNWGVGDVILLRQTPFRVIGVVEAGGGAIESELSSSSLALGDRVVFVPDTVRPDWVTEMPDPEAVLDGIFVRVSDKRPFNRTVSQAQRLMSQPEYKADSLSWITPEELIRGVRRLQLTIQLAVGGISFLCLILGGTTMMSLMVANVRSRVAEIGLRRALGATSRDIVLLFVAEAAFVTLSAGLTGMAMAHLLLLAGRSQFSIPVNFGLASAAIPLLAALILGVAFSWWPARTAAAIAPSEALRND